MTKKIAFLGYGLRSKTMLQAFREIEADISVAAVADPRWEQIKEENAGDPLFAEARYFENADALLGGCEPDGVFIGTRCPLHTPLAVEVLKRDIPLFLEKPVCISEAQYRTLREAAEGKLDRAVVSFPLRVADITVRLRQLVESGAIISYNQNFTVKRTAARRGCRIIGTKGSAELDFYTGVIRHDDYAFDQTATIRIRPTGGNHFGGDRRLAQDFMNLLAGGTPSSDLLGGLRSAACCLAAKRSAETNCLTDILP